jgi:hypothetical protein
VVDPINAIAFFSLVHELLAAVPFCEACVLSSNRGWRFRLDDAGSLAFSIRPEIFRGMLFRGCIAKVTIQGDMAGIGKFSGEVVKELDYKGLILFRPKDVTNRSSR